MSIFSKSTKEGEISEQEFFNSLNSNEKEEFLRQKVEKKKFQFGLVFLALMLVIIIGGYFFLKSEVNKAYEENIVLEEQSLSIKKQIDESKEIETLLQDVSINGKISQEVLKNRDEVIFVLEAIEEIIPNNVPFKVNKVQRLSKNNYKIDFELPVFNQSDMNTQIVNIAYLSSIIDKSQFVISQKANGSKSYFKLSDFRGATYSKSTQSFPISMTLIFVNGEEVSGTGKTMSGTTRQPVKTNTGTQIGSGTSN